jgi:soluble lytic murein transglycosylase-like protein
MDFLNRAAFLIGLFLVSMWFGYLIGMLFFASTARADVNQTVVTIIKESKRNGIDPLLVAAIIKVESNWRANAIGTSGEVGLMQLRPEFHKDASVKTGIEYLAYLRRRCGKDAFVTCYNNGPNRKPKYPRLHPYSKKVYSEYEALKKAR